MKLRLWRVIAPVIVAAAPVVLPHANSAPSAAAHRRVEESRQAQQCPTVTVSCAATVEAGQETTYTANVSGGDPNVTPTFNWTVSAGTISSGQGTSSITVETAGAGGQSVTATVDVGGYSRECRTSDSCSASLAKRIEASKGDEYVVINSGEEKARLDRYAAALQQEPSAQAYVITYGGRTSRPDVARKAGERVRDHLVLTRGLDAARITLIDGGRRENPATELWIVPPGAMPPTATPTVAAEGVRRAPAKPKARPRPAPGRRKKM
jgi:hypothetical protein